MHEMRDIMSKVFQCIECGYCDTDNTNWKGYVKCTKLGIYVDPNSNSCYRSIERAQPYSSGCYLTTAMCNILGFDDDCKYLNILRSFRDDYMKFDPVCLPLLMEYDMLGPLVSKHLNNDVNNKQIANIMLNKYIIPACVCISAHDYEQAIEIYTSMTKSLIGYYNIPFINIPNMNEESIDINTLGKARIKRIY